MSDTITNGNGAGATPTAADIAAAIASKKVDEETKLECLIDTLRERAQGYRELASKADKSHADAVAKLVSIRLTKIEQAEREAIRAAMARASKDAEDKARREIAAAKQKGVQLART